MEAEQPGDDCELQLPAPRWSSAWQLEGGLPGAISRCAGISLVQIIRK